MVADRSRATRSARHVQDGESESAVTLAPMKTVARDQLAQHLSELTFENPDEAVNVFVSLLRQVVVLSYVAKVRQQIEEQMTELELIGHDPNS